MFYDVGVALGRLGGNITIMPSHCVCDYVNVWFPEAENYCVLIRLFIG